MSALRFGKGIDVLDSTYLRYIYEWLTSSGLSGSTNQLLTELGLLDESLTTLANKLDGLSLQLQELLASVERLIYIGLFFGLLWFAMQFVQKRWYTS